MKQILGGELGTAELEKLNSLRRKQNPQRYDPNYGNERPALYNEYPEITPSDEKDNDESKK